MNPDEKTVDIVQGVGTDPSLEQTIDKKPAENDTRQANPAVLLGAYELCGELARGGMGIVYRARQINADRMVALKVVRSIHPDPRELNRFQKEVQAAANLDHPNIVPVYDVGQIDGLPYFTMKLVEGESLAGRLSDKPIASREAAQMLRTVAHAIEFAHGRKIIHRDIKPGNILLDNSGEPHVTDFGLAKVSDKPSDLTGEGQALGTPSYMPPEQALGKHEQVNERSDIYALGAVLYACLTGRPPFQAASTSATIIQLLTKEPVPPRQLNSEIDLDVETICLKCLEKDATRRYQTAAEFAAELKRYLGGQPILARPVTRVERIRKWSKRNPLVATLSAFSVVAVLALILGGGVYQWRLAVALKDAQRARANAQTSEAEKTAVLYDALVVQAGFLNKLRPVGYGTAMWNAIDEARKLDTPARDETLLRRLAVSSLGRASFDRPVTFSGLGPNASPIQIAEVTPEESHLFVGLASGEIVIFGMDSLQIEGRHDAHSQGVVGIHFPDSRTCYTNSAYCQEVHKWEFNGNQWSHAGAVDTERPEGMTDVRLSRDGRLIVSYTERIPEDHKQFDLLSETPRGISKLGGKAFFCVRPVENGNGRIHLTNLRASRSFDLYNRYLVAFDAESILKVYDLERAQVIQSYSDAFGGEIISVDPKGEFIACGNHVGGNVLSIETGQEIANLAGRDCHVRQISNDSSSIVFLESNVQRVFSMASREVEFESSTTGHSETIWFSGRFRLTIDSEANQVSIMDAEPAECKLWTVEAETVDDVAFSPDGTSLLCSRDRLPLRICDVESKEVLGELAGAQRAAFHPSGQLLATSTDTHLELWSLPELSRISLLPKDVHFNRLRFDAAGKLLLCYGWEKGRFAIYKLNSQEPDFADAALEQVLVDTEGGASADWNQTANELAWVKFSSIGSKAFIQLLSFDAHNPLTTQFASAPSDRYCILAFPRSDCVCVLSAGGLLQSWNPKTGEMINQSRAVFRRPICKSPDGNYLLCQHKIVSVDTLEEIFELPSFAGEAWGIDWSPDNRHVAIGYVGGEVAVWDLEAVRFRMERLGLAWEQPAYRELGALPSLQVLRDKALHASANQPSAIAWTSVAECWKRLEALPNQVPIDQWCRNLARILPTAQSDRAEFIDILIWVGENAPYDLSKEKTADMFGRVHGSTNWRDASLLSNEYGEMMAMLIEKMQTIDQPKPATQAIQALIYENYADWIWQTPSRLVEADQYHGKAVNKASQLVSDGTYSKQTFGHRWFWMYCNHAQTQHATGNHTKAIELMTEALNCVGEGVYQPEERFLIEFQMKLRLWKENQN